MIVVVGHWDTTSLALSSARTAAMERKRIVNQIRFCESSRRICQEKRSE